MNYPQTSVIFAFTGGFFASLALHFAHDLGYDAPPDIAQQLPFAIAILLAHYVPDRQNHE